MLRFLVVTSVILICGDGCVSAAVPAPEGAARESDELQALSYYYEIRQTELHLAQKDSLYMVLHFGKGQIELKLRGTVTWNSPIFYSQDSQAEIERFVAHFQKKGGLPLRFLTAKNLFSARNEVADSILTIVAKSLNVPLRSLQHELPGKFQLYWEEGLLLEATTEMRGTSHFRIKNALFTLQHIRPFPLSRVKLALKMDPYDALTLYSAAYIGMPTLIYPLSAASDP